MSAYFVDTHCHMFTLGDIPLHAVLEDTIDHPLAILFAGIVGKIAFHQLEDFIKFFDSETLENVNQVADEMNDALQAEGIAASQRILTPLVMDFDANGKIEKFGGQVKRLAVAAQAYGTRRNTKVLPFVGLDPRRLVHKNGVSGAMYSLSQVNTNIDGFLSGGTHRIEKITPQNISNLSGGTLVGIKIYPPLGFNVYPDNQEERKRYLAIYKKIAQHDIPITAHCQTSSFNLCGSDAKDFTSPDNWRKVLETNNNLKKLRLNLGHFGGDEGVLHTVKWTQPLDDAGNETLYGNGVNSQGWTFKIIELLKKFPNTYADISAFNFKDEKATAALLWLLAYDQDGRFTGNYALEDKLMWGSDYPMILNKRFPNYHAYFSSFVKAIIKRSVYAGNQFQPPRNDQLPEPDKLLEKLASTNPAKFLGIIN